MKINFFKPESPLFLYRWFIVGAIVITAIMVYHDLSGGRLFTFRQQQQWNSSGPGYHK